MDLKQIETELREATDGLLMRSETEAPFEFYHAENMKGEPLNEETVLRLAAMPADYPFEETELSYFFRHTVKAQPEAGESQAERFEQLEQKLQTLLQDVKVYRVGDANKLVLILGRTPDGEIAGLKTMVVEN